MVLVFGATSRAKRPKLFLLGVFVGNLVIYFSYLVCLLKAFFRYNVLRLVLHPATFDASALGGFREPKPQKTEKRTNAIAADFSQHLGGDAQQGPAKGSDFRAEAFKGSRFGA